MVVVKNNHKQPLRSTEGDLEITCTLSTVPLQLEKITMGPKNIHVQGDDQWKPQPPGFRRAKFDCSSFIMLEVKS